jgi:raffinose/stachyose/melibiose transport system permease protein
MAPALVLMLVFFVIPVIYVIVVSFLKWNGIADPVFVGIKNFRLLFRDKAFVRSVTNNIIWALVAGFIQVPLAMLMAIILSRRPKGWKFFRTVYFFPQVISGIALATLWRAVYNAETGLLNGLLRSIGLGNLAKDWLGTIETAFPAVLIYWIFYVGYYMVIMMADITTIDESYYEAATIDGATDFQQAIYITIPLIKKTSLLTCVTLASVMGLRQFEQVYMLTNGGPANRTSTIVLYMYKKLQDSNYGLSGAAAVILIIVGVVFIVCIRKIFEGRSEEAAAAKRARRAMK